MKCHYTYDKVAGKVLIPGCAGVVLNDDMKYCTCRDSTETFEQFERKIYKEKLSELQAEISDLEKYNASLQRIIKRLLKK